MKKTYLAFASAAFLLAACGDEVTEVTQVNQASMEIVSSVSKLPKCTSDNEGEMALVKGETSVRVCVDGEWFATASGDAGDFSCKTEELKDGSGLKIICNGDSIGVVLNGEKGDSGKDGKDGSDGKDAELPSDTLEADSEQVAISLDSLAGYSQKSPFLKGSTVYLYELSDGRTLKQTNGNFTSIITRDDGRYKFTARDLVSQYAMIVVDGNYRNEVTGKSSEAPIRLRAITDMRKRSDANINLLTHLEFDRVYHLVTRGDSTGKKLTVKQAKRQAQKEILKQFHIELDSNTDAEDLDVFGKTDADAALLAISVLLQGDGNATDLSILLTEIADDMETDGKWDGEKADSIRAEIADWAATADTAGRLDSVFNHVKGWGLGGGNVPDFKKFVRNFWYTENKLGACGDGGSLPGTVKEVSNKNSKRYYAENYTDIGTTDVRFICDSTSSLWRPAINIEKDTAGWGAVDEGMVRVGQINRDLIYVFHAYRWRRGTVMDTLLKKKDGSYDACLHEGYFSDTTYEDYYYECKLFVDGAILGWVKTDDLFNDTYESQHECREGGRYGDGTLLEGRVNKGHFYVCDNDVFRVADPAEVTGGLGCTSYNLDTLVILKNQYSYYRCTKTGWELALEKKNEGTIKYGGKTYRTIGIGTQNWMAENLDFEYRIKPSEDEDTVSYGNYCNTDDCETYGRYYTWAAAMDSAGVYSENSKGCGYGKECSPVAPVRGICPEGWHLPSRGEIDSLYSFAGDHPQYALQALGYENWPYATDTLGFSALPAGYYGIETGLFYHVGESADFWGTTEYESDLRFAYSLNMSDHKAYQLEKSLGVAVRCVENKRE